MNASGRLAMIHLENRPLAFQNTSTISNFSITNGYKSKIMYHPCMAFGKIQSVER